MNYNIYFFMVKPTTVAEMVGSSGEATTVSPTSASAVAARNAIIGQFKSILASLFRECTSLVPGPTQSYTFSVQEISAASPGVPNFNNLTIARHEPIVYFTTRETRRSPASPIDRRTSHALLDALAAGNYPEFPSSFISDARNGITSEPSGAEGKAMVIQDYAPMVAEVFSSVRMAYDATNWREIQANLLARIAFHEIAHCKAECQNRATSNRWRPAISGSIHDYSKSDGTAVEVCSSSIDWSASLSGADKELMGRHMLCPVPFYRLGVDVSTQFFHHGASIQLTSG